MAQFNIRSMKLASLNRLIQKLTLTEGYKITRQILQEEDGNFSSVLKNDTVDDAEDITVDDKDVSITKITAEKENLLNTAMDLLKTSIETTDKFKDALNSLQKLKDKEEKSEDNKWQINEKKNTATLAAKNMQIFIQNNNICFSDGKNILVFKTVKALHDYLKENEIPLPQNIQLRESKMENILVIKEDNEKIAKELNGTGYDQHRKIYKILKGRNGEDREVLVGWEYPNYRPGDKQTLPGPWGEVFRSHSISKVDADGNVVNYKVGETHIMSDDEFNEIQKAREVGTGRTISPMGADEYKKVLHNMDKEELPGTANQGKKAKFNSRLPMPPAQIKSESITEEDYDTDIYDIQTEDVGCSTLGNLGMAVQYTADNELEELKEATFANELFGEKNPLGTAAFTNKDRAARAYLQELRKNFVGSKGSTSDLNKEVINKEITLDEFDPNYEENIKLALNLVAKYQSSTNASIYWRNGLPPAFLKLHPGAKLFRGIFDAKGTLIVDEKTLLQRITDIEDFLNFPKGTIDPSTVMITKYSRAGATGGGDARSNEATMFASDKNQAAYELFKQWLQQRDETGKTILEKIKEEDPETRGVGKGFVSMIQAAYAESERRKQRREIFGKSDISTPTKYSKIIDKLNDDNPDTEAQSVSSALNDIGMMVFNEPEEAKVVISKILELEKSGKLVVTKVTRESLSRMLNTVSLVLPDTDVNTDVNTNTNIDTNSKTAKPSSRKSKKNNLVDIDDSFELETESTIFRQTFSKILKEALLLEKDPSPADFADNLENSSEDIIPTNDINVNTDTEVSNSLPGNSNSLDMDLSINDDNPAPEGEFGNITSNFNGIDNYSPDTDDENMDNTSNVPPVEDVYRIVDVMYDENDPENIKVKIENQTTKEVEIKDISEIDI